MTTNTIEDINTEEKLSAAFKNSENFTIIPVLKLIFHELGIDLYREFGLKYKLSSKESETIKYGNIEILGPENKKLIIMLDIVDKDYNLMSTLKQTDIIENKQINNINELNKDLSNQIIDTITYLTHSCLLIFNNLKNNYKELIEYNIQLDNNTTIYINKQSGKRIGIIFKNSN